MTDTIWSDEPPTEPGWYWLKDRRRSVWRAIWYRNENGIWGDRDALYTGHYVAKSYQFGPRVPDPETCAGIQKGDK